MPNVNIVLVAGHLTRAPELKFLANGTAVADIGMAVSDRHKNASGEWVETPIWLEVTAWGKQAETAAQHLSKGSACLVEGRLKLDEWQDKRTSEKRQKLRITADRIQFLGGKGEKQERGEPQEEPQQPKPQQCQQNIPADDVPF